MVTVSVYLVELLLVFKFVEPPENNEKPMEQKSGVKFKIMSLKMKVPTDYMPELVCKNGSFCSESVRVKYVMGVVFAFLFLQFEEQKDHVSEEQVMRVVFLDPENPNPVSLSFFLPVLVAVKCDLIGIMLHLSLYSLKMMEKLKSQLAEADAADEARKKAPEVISSGPKPIGEGLVIDEWVRALIFFFFFFFFSVFKTVNVRL